MCAAIGVDPLVSNVGMWAQLLGIGDFYSELGVQVIEACLATRCAQWACPALQRGCPTSQPHSSSSSEHSDVDPSPPRCLRCLMTGRVDELVMHVLTLHASCLWVGSIMVGCWTW